ncbi:RNA polymerase sigma factor [Streptomyces acidiscabies]|uniref:RNA polymerase sigma24 factor n=1 Tax=Streptomyces acidiscabies TaxID=42234 RepID=A0A0L0KBJ1_9ACTN|nr:RNA polymerase sigma factor [Streptomyces acidiscabies]KND35196.1 RNA polymerase sigma24 factor [Streptomyces acidiscabies]
MEAERKGVPSDAELLDAVAEGDRDAFEELFRRFAPWLRGRLRQRCADHALVDEVVQDVFVEVWRRRERRGDRVGDVSGWLWRAGSHRLIDARRAHERRGRLLARLARLPGRHAASPEDQLMTELGDGALAAVEHLPADLRAVVRATTLEGLTVQETAERLNIPPGTVKSRASRARRLLRERLTS